VLEQVSADYEGQVAFLAIGGSGTAEATAERAEEWIPSGRVMWGLDESLRIWSIFGVSGTPSTILMGPDGEVITGWAGERAEAEMRQAIDLLISETS